MTTGTSSSQVSLLSRIFLLSRLVDCSYIRICARKVAKKTSAIVRERAIFSAILVSKRSRRASRPSIRPLLLLSPLLSSLSRHASSSSCAHLEPHTMTRAHSPSTHTRARTRVRARAAEDTPSLIRTHTHARSLSTYIHMHVYLLRSSPTRTHTVTLSRVISN